MNVAFYAPMKPPSHPAPSGDRRMARLLMAALETAGHRVELASVLRSWDGTGDATRQGRLKEIGRRMAERLLRRYRAGTAQSRPQAWFTYHLYHKAPDWLGPSVSDALGIPYVVAEASHAPKRQGGPWSIGFDAVAAALARADLVLQLNAADAACVRPLLKAPERLVMLPPFVDAAPYDRARRTRDEHRADLAARVGLDPHRPWLLAVGMMRPGDKLASYRHLAAALGRLRDRPWHLLVVGDGAARPQVEAALVSAAVPATFLGLLTPEALPPVLAAADLFVWPAVNEAYGMALLEAQAAGLPVVAGRVGGVPGVVADGETGILVPVDDTAAFAAAVDGLLADTAGRRAMGAAAVRRVAGRHGLAAAAIRIDDALQGLG